MPTRVKKVLPIKVPQKVVEEFDDIQISEGFGNRASTFTFLVKFYQLKKQSESEQISPLLQDPELRENLLQLSKNPSLNFLQDEPDLYEEQ